MNPRTHPADEPLDTRHHALNPEVAWTKNGLEPVTPFPFEEIDRRLGYEDEESPAIETWSPEKLAHAREALEVFLRWLSAGSSLETIGLRSAAFCWAVRPDLFNGISGAELARKLNVTKQALSRYVRIVFAKSNGRFRNGAMRPAEFREKMRGITTESHKRAGHKLHHHPPNGK